MTSDSVLFLRSILFVIKFDLIGMQLKQEGLRIFFIFSMFTRIVLESNTSEEIVMLALDDVESRTLVSNKSHEVCMSEFLF